MRIAKQMLLVLVISALGTLTSYSATILFQDNFDSGFSGSNWQTNTSASDAFADFAFDYSSLGIPAAPRSNGTTIGMRFLVNQSAGLFQGISASPIGQSFTGDFKIEFDMWLNYVGPLATGGNGSTQMASFGWGTSGTTVQWAGSNHSVLFAGSGDGGTAQDYRVYRRGTGPAGAPLAPTTGVYAAGTNTAPDTLPDARNNIHPYYESLGGYTAPQAQVELFPEQSGVTPQGTLGMSWQKMTIEKVGDVLTWDVGSLRIVTVSIEDFVPGGDNISFGMFDINDSSSNELNDFLNTAIFDNVLVTVPEPASVLLCTVAAGGLLMRRRRP